MYNNIKYTVDEEDIPTFYLHGRDAAVLWALHGFFVPNKLCEDLDNDIWGDGYKVPTGRFVKTNPVDLTLDMAKNIAEVHFPRTMDDHLIIPYELEGEMTMSRKTRWQKVLRMGRHPDWTNARIGKTSGHTDPYAN
ncbi:hypothetical protein JTB14_013633 [Gonioctena quinquepunctata]|nr:hypothetical protein JTB14_013633 [Gonioctena quinquepunctata]